VHPNDAGYQVMATDVYNYAVSNSWPGISPAKRAQGGVLAASTIT
jgi:hypothetical protein